MLPWLTHHFHSLCRCVNHYITSEIDCHLANGTFYYPSQSEEECLSYSFCWTPQSIVTGLLTPLDSLTGNCTEARMQSLFQWESAKWIGGSWAYTNWTLRQPVQANKLAMSINFTLLQSSVSFSADESELTSLQNQVCI